MHNILGTEDVTWYVRNESQAELYSKAGAKHIRISDGYQDGSGKPGDLVLKRNESMDDAFALGHTILMLSDDLKKVQLIVEDPSSPGGKGGGLRVDDWNFKDAVRYQLAMMEYFPEYKLCGIPPTNNAFFIHHIVSTNLFCINDWLICKPNPIRMDTRIKLKIDYDLTANHIKTYGGIVRPDFCIPFFEHYMGAGAGGCDTRDYELEDQDIAYLFQNHPGMFVPHKTRLHEVSTKFVSTRPSIETFNNKAHYEARKDFLAENPDIDTKRNEVQILKGARTLSERITRKQQLVAYYNDQFVRFLEKAQKAKDQLEKEKADLEQLLIQQQNSSGTVTGLGGKVFPLQNEETPRYTTSGLILPPLKVSGQNLPSQRHEFNEEEYDAEPE